MAFSRASKTAALTSFLFIISQTAITAAQYVLDGTNSPLACTEFANETCTAECSTSNASYAVVINCGESGQCIVDCTALNCVGSLEVNTQNSNELVINNVASCISSSIVVNVGDAQDLTLNMTGDSHAPLILNAENGTAIDLFSSAFRGLSGAVINVPKSGDAALRMSAGESFRGLTVNAGADTQSIHIDCTFGAGHECHGLQVNAATAQFLQVDVGLDSELNGGAVIFCPVDSAYTSAEAPCVVDVSAGGSVDNVTIHAADGIPDDLWIETGDTTTLPSLSLVCDAGESEAPFLLSSDCWHTPAPTEAGLSAQRDPTVSPTMDPTVVPSYAPTAPTNAPTPPPNVATAAQGLPMDRLTLIIIICAGVLGFVLVCCAITICCYIRFVQNYIEKEKTKYANRGPQVWDPRLMDIQSKSDGPGAATGAMQVASDEEEYDAAMPASLQPPNGSSFATTPPQNPVSFAPMFGAPVLFGAPVQVPVPMQPQPYAPPRNPMYFGGGGPGGAPPVPGGGMNQMPGMNKLPTLPHELPSQPQVNAYMQQGGTPNAVAFNGYNGGMAGAVSQQTGGGGVNNEEASDDDDDDDNQNQAYQYTKGTDGGAAYNGNGDGDDDDDLYEYYEDEDDGDTLYAAAGQQRKKPAPPPPRGRNNPAQAASGGTPMHLAGGALSSSPQKANKWSKWQGKNASSPMSSDMNSAVGVSYDDSGDDDFGGQSFGGNQRFGKKQVHTVK